MPKIQSTDDQSGPGTMRFLGSTSAF